GGRRPYPRWLSAALLLGWVILVGLILFLWIGPEPGNRLFLLEAMLVGLWFGLMLIAATVAAMVGYCAWRTGRGLRTRLEDSQVRLRINGGLTIKGGSAGLPFCLNILSSLHRAQPRDVRHSWLWREFFQNLRSRAECWAATGVITMDGHLKPVVLEPKL